MTLYCIFGKVLVIIDVINVKHYIDNINRKHNVAMATSPSPPPPVNMADILHTLINDISREAESKEMLDKLDSRIKYSLLSKLSHSDRKNVLVATTWQ